MKFKTWEIILIVVILVGLSLVPSIFSLSIIHYVTGVVSVIAILIALAYFVMKTGTPIPEELKKEEPEDAAEKTKWQKCMQAVKRSWQSVFDTCNNVGFILFLCILLIIGIGVFDALMSKDNEVSNKCDCIQTTVIQKSIPQHTDTIHQAQSDTIR